MSGTPINPGIRKQVPATERGLLDSFKTEVFKELNAVKVGVITAYNAGVAGQSAPTVSVQIAFLQVTSAKPDGTYTYAPYTEIKEVPVMFPSGGGCIMTFPIAVGDECVVFFNDRQLDNWHINGAGPLGADAAPPTVPRLHDFSDAIAFVGLRSNPNAIATPSTTAAQLRTLDGEAFVEVGNDHHITATTPPGAEINFNGMTIDSSGNVTIPGTLNVTGNATITGTVTGAGVGLDTHHHTGVQTGSGNTGGPVG